MVGSTDLDSHLPINPLVCHGMMVSRRPSPVAHFPSPFHADSSTSGTFSRSCKGSIFGCLQCQDVEGEWQMAIEDQVCPGMGANDQL